MQELQYVDGVIDVRWRVVIYNWNIVGSFWEIFENVWKTFENGTITFGNFGKSCEKIELSIVSWKDSMKFNFSYSTRHLARFLGLHMRPQVWILLGRVLFSLIWRFSRLHYQPLFGKGARAPPRPDTRERRKSSLAFQFSLCLFSYNWYITTTFLFFSYFTGRMQLWRNTQHASLRSSSKEHHQHADNKRGETHH